MFYIIKNQETNDIISIKSRISSGDLGGDPKPIVTEIDEETITLDLPGPFYLKSTRPHHIILTDINKFTLMPGIYQKREYFEFITNWVNDVCTVDVKRKISGHYEVSKTDEVYENLGPEDIDSIIMDIFQESIDEDFNGDIEFNLGGKYYTVTLTAGVGQFTLDYSNLYREHTIPFYDGDGVKHKLRLKIPNLTRAKCILREDRGKLLLNCDWLVIRHQTQVAASLTPDLTETEYQELLAYMQALRNLPENTTDPLNPVWPTPPSFI
jgi:hypothetical protein